MKKAYIVEYCIRTRVVVDAPEGYVPFASEETKITDDILIAKADDKILAEPASYIIGDNIAWVEEDEECPAGTLAED